MICFLSAVVKVPVMVVKANGTSLSLKVVTTLTARTYQIIKNYEKGKRKNIYSGNNKPRAYILRCMYLQESLHKRDIQGEAADRSSTWVESCDVQERTLTHRGPHYWCRAQLRLHPPRLLSQYKGPIEAYIHNKTHVHTQVIKERCKAANPGVNQFLKYSFNKKNVLNRWFWN